MRVDRPENRSGEYKEEIYYYLHWSYVFNVQQANQIVDDGREPVEVDEESVRYAVETSDLTAEHVALVDLDRPGIIAHVSYTTNEGETIKGHLLIDGNHRAARCLKLGRPFFAYVLTEEESEMILVRRPECGQLDYAVLAEPANGAIATANSGH